MDDYPTTINADGIYEPFSIDCVPKETHLHGTRFGMTYQHLSRYGGGSQISLAMEVLEPGRQANPAHYHTAEEEHVLMLEGSATLMLGARRYILLPGHYVCFPAGQRAGHALYNHTDTPCRYLVLGNPQPHDVAVFPDTGRVEVRALHQGFRGDAQMAYWDGIDVDGDTVHRA